MITSDIDTLPKVLQLYLEISQYPALAPVIRKRMRGELFRRGIVSNADLEQEAKHKALLSQKREGLAGPFVQEKEDMWQQRLAHFRDNLTDFYFAQNLPLSLFEEIVRDVLVRRMAPDDVLLTFNPEMAPWEMLVAQAEAYEALPPEKQTRVEHHLQEIKVVLIKGLISDHLGFVGIAKNLFTTADLKTIHRRRIGRGKIGGKAAGMMLAWKMLNLAESNEEMDVGSHVVIPESYFIGADVVYDFMSLNNLHYLGDQKYKSGEQIEADYPHVREAFSKGRFVEDIVDGLRGVLDRVGNHPLIVRSSSLLEDSVGTSFAGKYESYFCPNQATPDENLTALLRAISMVYASVFSPDALSYRRQMGLLDYDERMAILLQEVQGEYHGCFFFPTLAGVGFSYNPFRWSTVIQARDGFLRLVWGIGTRAVGRVDNDYPRMVALSHPHLRPVIDPTQIKRYSQHFVDVLNLAENEFQTRPVTELLSADFPSARQLISVNYGDYVRPPLAYDPSLSPSDLILTFENLLTKTRFVPLMKAILQTLSARFGHEVDIEFTADILPGYPQPEFCIHLLQCRPLAGRQTGERIEVPTVSEADMLFTADRLVPHGRASRIRYIVFVDPEAYARIPDETTRLQVARVVGQLNQKLKQKSFVLMGPGRWGSANLDLGVKITYADIYNTAVLIEIGLSDGGSTPEVSYGTHFFQSLVESEIYPLALFPGQGEAFFNWRFLRESTNILGRLLPDCVPYAEYVRVIDVPAVTGGRFLEVVMDSEKSQALGYLRDYAEENRA